MDPLLIAPLPLAYQKQKNTLFFGRCPPEIRNAIYERLFLAVDPLRPATYPAPHLPEHFDASIARTCRVALWESYAILYGRNTFHFASGPEIWLFEKRECRLHFSMQCVGLQIL